MTEERLARLRVEFKRLETRQAQAQDALDSLKNTLRLIAKYQEVIEKGEILSPDDLARIGITSRTTLGVHYKLLGQRRRVEMEIVEKEVDINKIQATLTSRFTCPDCSGTGLVNKSKNYERMQEGVIIPVVSMSDCPLCKGTGKLEL